MYCLCVFQMEKKREFDIAPYLDKGIFTELKKESYFQQARVAFGGIVWPNNQDFSADTIDYELRKLK